MTDGTNYFHNYMGRLHWCGGSRCYIPLEPPEGFEEWFFAKHNIYCYDCGEESTANNKRVNEFDQNYSHTVPFSNSFNFKPTKKPRFNEFAYPLQHQRYSDSFWLVHLEEGDRKESFNPQGVNLGAFIGMHDHRTAFKLGLPHPRVLFPHGNHFFQVRQAYTLQDVPEKFASIFYNEDFYPFDSSSTKAAQKNRNWHLASKEKNTNSTSNVGHVIVLRMTDARYNLANMLVNEFEILDNPPHVIKQVLVGNSRYFFGHLLDDNFHPDEEITTGSVTLNGFAASAMTKGQMFDFLSYANGILGFRGMSLNIANSIQATSISQYVMKRFFNPSVSQSVEVNYVVKALPNNNSHIGWDSLKATINGFNYYDRILGAPSQTFLTVTCEKEGSISSEAAGVLWNKGHAPTFHTLFGEMYDIERANDPALGPVERNLFSDEGYRSRLAPMVGCQLYSRQTDSCDWSLMVRLEEKNAQHPKKTWYDILMDEIAGRRMPMPEIMYIRDHSTNMFDHYDGQGNFVDPLRRSVLQNSWFDIDFVAYHEKLLPTHLPIMPPATIFDAFPQDGAAFDNGQHLMVMASDFYDAANTRTTNVPDTVVEKVVGNHATLFTTPRDGKIVTEIDVNLFVTSVLPTSDADYALLNALLIREKNSHEFYAINISCTP